MGKMPNFCPLSQMLVNFNGNDRIGYAGKEDAMIFFDSRKWFCFPAFGHSSAKYALFVSFDFRVL